MSTKGSKVSVGLQALRKDVLRHTYRDIHIETYTQPYPTT